MSITLLTLYVTLFLIVGAANKKQDSSQFFKQTMSDYRPTNIGDSDYSPIIGDSDYSPIIGDSDYRPSDYRQLPFSVPIFKLNNLKSAW